MTASKSFSNRSCFRLAAFPVAVLGLIGGMVAAQAADNPEPNLAAPRNEIKIVSTEFKFTTPAQRIVAGQPVIFVLDNSQAESEHAIFFQALGVRLFAQAGEVVRKTVVFDKAGEFVFVCDLPGHREAGMIGTLVVRAGDKPAGLEIVGSIAK